MRAVHSAYCYHNTDPADIRNFPEVGGGIDDIGCYSITVARPVFDDKPRRAMALVEPDPVFATDRLSTAILEFPKGHASFVAATQATPYQHVEIIGSKDWIRAEYPFAHIRPTPCRLFVGDETSLGAMQARSIAFEAVNQYTLRGDRIAQRIRGRDVPDWPLETAVANMAVIDALFGSAASGRWETV